MNGMHFPLPIENGGGLPQPCNLATSAWHKADISIQKMKNDELMYIVCYTWSLCYSCKANAIQGVFHEIRCST